MAGGEPAQKVGSGTIAGAEERRLVEAAQQDPVRFAELYEKYFVVVYAYVARRMRDRAESEDLTAEVFRKALAGLPRFKWTGAPFAAWLLRIASNMIADRAKKIGPQTTELVVSADRDHANEPLLKTAERQQADLENAERWAHLFRAVEMLPDDQRRVVVLRFADEKSIRDIANELGRSEGAVKQLQFRAL
ncbi:MAG TPA: sigma-70 family RNA polymerase sigma factor, partial [Pyrinomonadaceae bacterium]|nr:sigma-70 family RNA polymerase sigma factor [Pyrinomonadaceae bacterium]